MIVMISQEYPPYLVGGIGTQVQQLARGLVREGHLVHLFTYGMDQTFTTEDHGVHLHFLQFPLVGRGNQYEAEVSELAHLNGELNRFVSALIESNMLSPDAIHVHEWLGYPCADSLRRRLHAPVVMTAHTVHGWLLENLMSHGRAAEISRLEQTGLWGADRVLAVSHSVKREIVARYGVAESQVEVVFNGLDADSLTASLSPASAEHEREVLGGGDDRLIVYAGRLSPQKGISALLRSAMQVLQEKEDVTYVLAGGLAANPYADYLRMMAGNHPRLKQKVLFPGHVSRERLAAFYHLATLAIVPSVFEPFGYAALEPMAMGKAVVATQTGGLAEIIEDDVSGLLVPLVTAVNTEGAATPDVDVGALCQAQLRILDDPSLAARLGGNARIRVRHAFRSEQMIARTLEVYRSAMDARRPAEARA